jgi:mannose/cellobiose epimerase-like protein (N-acyl-D-glucosamine 2-epimerase family)
VQLDQQGVLPRQRLNELISICSEVVVDQRTSGCRDQFSIDWSPLRGLAYDRCSYGHDLENVALLQLAAKTLGTPGGDLLERCRKICRNAISYGRDSAEGGFFAAGPLGAPADRLEKVYWVEAEAIFALATMWQVEGERSYLDCLEQTLAWVDERQVDRAGGDWHSELGVDGSASGSKAGAWRDPYHQTRALLAVSNLATSEPAEHGGAARQ